MIDTLLRILSVPAGLFLIYLGNTLSIKPWKKLALYAIALGILIALIRSFMG